MHPSPVEPLPAEQVTAQIAKSATAAFSPLGSPTTVARLRQFATCHGIEPITETYRFEQVNEVFDQLRSGKARCA